MDPEIEAVRELEDPLKQAQQASELLTRYQTAVTQLSRIRREAIEQLIAKGMTKAQLAEHLGMTRARVGQLLAAGPRSEGLFLGNGKLTVALGAKLEADKPQPSPVVSQQVFQAYERLSELARTLGLDAQYEVIPPPGLVDLNRDNLVVICGPRLSPIIAQVLASDPNLGFAHDDHGWYLVDHATGTTYRSPRDHGRVGRLRLPRAAAPHRRPRHLPVLRRHPRPRQQRRHALPGRAPGGAIRRGPHRTLLDHHRLPVRPRQPPGHQAASGSPRCTGPTAAADARRHRHPARQPRHPERGGGLHRRAPGRASSSWMD